MTIVHHRVVFDCALNNSARLFYRGSSKLNYGNSEEGRGDETLFGRMCVLFTRSNTTEGLTVSNIV